MDPRSILKTVKTTFRASLKINFTMLQKYIKTFPIKLSTQWNVHLYNTETTKDL